MKAFEYQDIRPFTGESTYGPPPLANANSVSQDPHEQLATRLLQVHDEGVRQGEQNVKAEYAQSMIQERARITAAVKQFEVTVADYYSRIEVEVVKLSLAIATKILHRESQVDPLLVAALARVALDKLHRNTRTVIRVRPEETSGWRQYFAQNTDQATMPEIVEDATVQPQSCTLETDLGSTELGVETQLKEIENGLFDLLAQRPQPK
ncbi:MAG: flagellar assembly protein FliH/Type III secretion system HrpE [Acidobacteria bacterium]|nr:flagellar assembly protein FliH/Type III secretion system HrpE [Acidobacteriota bacterium]